MHFDPLLKTAHDSGAEVMIQLRELCCDPYKGKITTLNADDFTLFHSGTDGGVLWSFLKKDVAFCGLLVERPDDPFKTLCAESSQAAAHLSTHPGAENTSREASD
ncbi:hypothetical protein [Vampirovibrio chlorellavorus]|uniref:hypothetical protein n=1 Tax=Vampirovibrio chlorellavorus TaxID=758823 RepID=UPI0026EDF480|nr:hypothetical protein [Vampirovibrio chlorellavorus]